MVLQLEQFINFLQIKSSFFFKIFLNDLFYFLDGLQQTTNYADDNSLTAIDHDIYVIKTDLELASGIAIQWFKYNFMKANASKFSVPQIEYPLGGSSKKGSHVYFLLVVAMVLPL